MNNDLISREALKKELNFVYSCAYIESKSKEGIASDIIDVIDNAPTVSFMISPDYVTELQNLNKELIKQLEEAERPQGEWIFEEDIITFPGNHLKCSNCGFFAEPLNDGNLLLSSFCPYCGAKMKER